ncbi:MAG: hypothetical protein PSX81_06650 [bacterium]|nr:hypothetical protein [bacterium]
MSYQNQILGTVISSVLNYDQFCHEIGENPAMNAARSSYSPCDGRLIVGSQLEIRTNHNITKAPDLRGKFMRGLNVIYSPGEPIDPFDPNTTGDPQANRVVMDYQGDEVKKHSHSMQGSAINCGAPPPSYMIINNTPAPTYNQASLDYGGDETRPRNISVYFYIKIN